jgi:hypothetical protein
MERDRGKLEERIKELEESEALLKKQIEYAQAQKHALDPWGFTKEADMGLRRFRTDSVSRKALAATSAGPLISPDVKYRSVAGKLRVNEEPVFAFDMEEEGIVEETDGIKSVELSNHINEMLAGSVPSRHFAAAKSISVPPTEKTAVLPDINQKLTFGDYTVSILTPRATDEIVENERRSVPGSASVEDSLYTAEWEEGEPEDTWSPAKHEEEALKKPDDEENFKMFFSMPRKAYESPFQSPGNSPRVQRAKSGDSSETLKKSNNPLSKTAPIPVVTGKDAGKSKPNTAVKKAPPKKKELAKLKVKNRSVYGCVDTEKDFKFVATKRQKSAGDGGLSTEGGLFAGLSTTTGSDVQNKSLVNRDISANTVKREWDSRFQKSPLDPRGSRAHEWTDDVDVASSTCNESASLTGGFDEPSVAATVDPKVFGLY